MNFWFHRQFFLVAWVFPLGCLSANPLIFLKASVRSNIFRSCLIIPSLVGMRSLHADVKENKNIFLDLNSGSNRVLQQISGCKDFQESLLGSLRVMDGSKIKIREFSFEENDLKEASSLIIENFEKRRDYLVMHPKIVQLYVRSNSPSKLCEALQQEKTRSFVIESDRKMVGIVAASFLKGEDQLDQLKIRRLHSKLDFSQCKGIGTTLLNVCAFTAQAEGVVSMTAYPTVPARRFLERLGWMQSGDSRLVHYNLDHEIVELEQYKYSVDLSQTFKGF